MTKTSSALQAGKLIPNWSIKDRDGEKHTLWDYRQKSHLVLIYDPKREKETVEHWKQAIAADRKQWDWLNVKVLLVADAPQELAPGIYTIDRYGLFISSFPLSNWNFDDLEKEFLYYEACHC